MRRSLCVGIDHYAFGPLQGCVSDAEGMARMLAQHEDGSPNFDCRTLVSVQKAKKAEQVTRARLREALTELFHDKAEVALFYFSGHGTENDLDGYLVTQDASKYDEGVAMGEVLDQANKSRADEVVVVLDCCSAGNLGSPPAIDNQKALLREGVSILTASRGDQVSVEVNGGGLFTSLVVDALGGGAADLLGDVTVPAIYAYVEAALGAWDQRPLFKSHVSKLIPLRVCEPALDPTAIRTLPNVFPLPAEDLQLDPSFEPSSPSAHATNVRLFEFLQRLCRVHLVVPVHTEHMYEAAMESKGCRLTASGRYYWRLARDKRI
jgi:hypothetical protein